MKNESNKKRYQYNLELSAPELWGAIERLQARARERGRGFLSKRDIIEQAIRNDRGVRRELREMGIEV